MSGELSDATALIHLAKADAFAEAAKIVGPLLVTPIVWEEAVVNGRRNGYADAELIDAAREAGDVTVAEVHEGVARHRDRLVYEAGLGAGESETLALAVATTRRAIVDDRAARRAASRLGVAAIPTVELALLGRARGVIARTEARALLHRLAVVAPLRAASMQDYERALEEMTDGH